MKQVVQSLKTGAVEVVEVPAPIFGERQVLVATTKTLISAGTERMMIDFGRGNLLQKARSQPDKVRMVIDKARTDGVLATLDTVRTKLGQPLAPGYCNVGVVEAVGSGVQGLAAGDRVVSNGKHAELVSVPINLCAKIPDGVADEDAVFTVVGAIALQGIRLAAPTLGETVAVIGLGLIGQLAIQLLVANGCRVIGFDFNESRVALARRFGAEGVQLSDDADVVAAADAFSRGVGIDAVLITAATESDQPIRDAARMSRKRGRIVLVGVAGLNLSRADFFEKELSFQVSCSYGPGRYDPRYEEMGHDYPLPFVRWTEQRNFEAVLDIMAAGKLDLAQLRTHEFTIDEVSAAYDIVGGEVPSMGVLLDYPRPAKERMARRVSLSPATRSVSASGSINFIGAGNYAGAVLVPAFVSSGAQLNAIGSATGLSAQNLASKFGFASAQTDVAALLTDPTADTVVIATRHDTHAQFALAALQAGKNVFVEKPLALTLEKLVAIEAFFSEREVAPLLTVGFNRRFAPLVQRMKAAISQSTEPLAITMTINAGAIDGEHWTQNPQTGGGRIVGEACHFIDLLRFLADSPIIKAEGVVMGSRSNDTVAITLQFANGSIGSINYFANGNKALPKERIEIFSDGRILQLDNYRRLKAHGWSRVSTSSLKQDKGQRQCAGAFIKAVQEGGDWPIPLDQLLEVSKVAIDLADRLR